MKCHCARSCIILVILPIMIAWPGFLFAQEHVNAWFRITSRYTLNDRITTDMEVQHRRQSSYNDHNPVSHPLMLSIRPWLYYRLNEDVQLAVSPLAWYRLFPIIEKPADVNGKYLTEYRSTIGISMKRKVNNNFTIGSRFMAEYRNFDRLPDILRVRARLGADYRFDRRYKLTIQEELLANLHGTPADHLFDHNRLGASITRQYSSDAWMELGYLYVNRLTPKNTELITEHNIFLHMGMNFTFIH